jgi:hypothetical protein
MQFAVGDILKSTESNFIFECVGFTEGHGLVPDNWPLCKEDCYHNPAFLRKYNGAISALNLSE